MPRPLLGAHPKQDVTLTLDPIVYEAAKVHARARRTSVSALVDTLLEREMDAARVAETPESKPLSPRKDVRYGPPKKKARRVKRAPAP